MHTDVIAAYADHIGATRSPSTVRAYLGHLHRLTRTHPDLFAVTTQDLERHLAVRRERGQAAESRKAFRTAIRVFFAWAHKTGRVAVDPAAELEPIPIPFRLARIADDATLAPALARANARDKALILCGRLAGLRLSEIATLETFDRRGTRLHIQGKGEKQRAVPLHEELGWSLAVLEREHGRGFYFPGERGNPHMHPQSVNKAITRLAGVNPHALRHAAATDFYNASGCDIVATQQFLGHSSVATTQRYLHLNFDRLELGVSKMGLAC